MIGFPFFTLHRGLGASSFNKMEIPSLTTIAKHRPKRQKKFQIFERFERRAAMIRQIPNHAYERQPNKPNRYETKCSTLPLKYYASTALLREAFSATRLARGTSGRLRVSLADGTGLRVP